jgi:glycosyltransferase involved in cell wall biosynthesis
MSLERASHTVLVIASFAPSLVNFRGPLLRTLQMRGYRVAACAPACTDTAAKLERSGVIFVPVEVERTGVNPFADLGYAYRLMRVIRRLQPAATIAYTAKPVIWGSFAARVVGVPRICAMVTGLGSAMMEEGSKVRLTGIAMKILYRSALSWTTRIAFQNPDDLHEFVNRGLAAREKTFRVNGSGVLLEHFSPVPLPDEPVFLLIARLLADKGIREYAAAAALLKPRFPNARFLLAGWFDDNPSGLTHDEVDAWVRSGVIEFVGRLADVRPTIAAARVYVLPSYREGTPRTVLEAMAMARPVITSDAPGCRETVEHGWNGFLVKPKSASELAAAMERFIVAPQLAEEMGARSRELAARKFDANAVANDLAEGFGL